MSKEALSWLNGLNKADIRIKPTAWRILECLALYHRHDAGCYISQARVADESNVSRSTVNTHLAILERHGLIARERRGIPGRGVRQTTLYHFPFEPTFHRFMHPAAVDGPPIDFTGKAKGSVGAAFVPATVQELDASFTDHTYNREVFHPDQIVGHCLEACGPGLCRQSRQMIRATNHVVIAWLKTGYSLEKDILPILRQRTRRVRARRITTWSYFTKAISEAHHRRVISVFDEINDAMEGEV